MKTLILLISITILPYISFSQNSQTCESPEDNFEDLNTISTISIKKCNIEESSSTRKITSQKKNNRTSHYVRKKSKKNPTKKNIKIKPKEIIFSVVDNIPLLKNCKNSKDKTCFNKQFYSHFSKNFNPETIYEDNINGKFFVQFTMNTNGHISNILVRGPKSIKNLEKEIKRVINKLPSFQAGTHKGFPVNVKHSLPINLSSY